MNKFNDEIATFFKDILKKQEDYKNEINQRVNFCLSITISLMALNFYLFINIPKVISNTIDIISIVLLSTVFVLIILILLFLAKAYIGIRKKHIYPSFPYASDLKKYYDELKSYSEKDAENKFLEYLIERYIHYSNNYQVVNDRKIKSFLKAYDFLLFALIPSSINLLLFGLKHFNIY